MIKSKDRNLFEYLSQSFNGVYFESDSATLQIDQISKEPNEILGYSRYFFLKNNSFITDHIHPNDKERVFDQLNCAAEQGEYRMLLFRMYNKWGNVVSVKLLVNYHEEVANGWALKCMLKVDSTADPYSLEVLDRTEHSYQLADIGHWSYDLEKNSLFWSSEVKKQHEVPDDYSPNVETAIDFYKPGEDREKISKAFADAIEHGTSYSLELRIITAKGNERWIRTFGEAEFVDGRCIRIFGSTQDITRHKQSLLEIERLSLVARETQNIVITTDAAQRITWVNKAFERHTGFSKEEVIGKNPGKILQGPDTDQETVRRISNKLNDKVTFTEQILNYDKKGHPYWIQMDITPVLDESGNIKEFFAIQEVITSQKKMQKELEEKTERLLEAQQIAQIGDWTYDKTSGVMTWSETLYDIFERNRSLKAPSIDDWATLFITGDGEKTFRQLVDINLEQSRECDQDFKIITENGNTKYVRVICSPAISDDGEISALRGIIQDISKSKKAERELKFEKEKLASITNNVSGLLLRYSFTPDGKENVIYASEGIRNVFELSPEEAVKDASKLYDRVLDEDRDELKRSIKASAKTLALWEHTWRIQTPKGGLKWLLGRGVPKKLDNGVVQWDSVIIDITEQEKAKNEANQLQEILEKSVNEIFIFDAKTFHFLYVNEAGKKNLGYAREELLEMTPLDIKPEYNPELFRELVQPLVLGKKETIHFQTFHERKNSTTYPIDVYLRKDFFGSHEVFVATILDITEKREIDQKFKSLIETAPIPIYSEQIDGIINGIWNKAAEDVLGFTKEEIGGSTLPTSTRDEDDEYRQLIDRIKNGETVRNIEMIRTRKDGSTFPARMNATPIKNNQGDVEEVLVIFENISEQKSLETELREQIFISDSILDSLPGLFYMIDENLNFVRVNSAFPRLFGKSVGKMLEKGILAMFYPNDRKNVMDKLSYIWEHGYAEMETNIEINGELYHLFLNGKLMELGSRKYIIGNGIDITQRVTAENRNEILLQEVHHRVKNNLAIVSGLLSLELEEFTDKKTRLSFQKSINRIQSMAKVHELLYQNDDYSKVEIEAYLRELAITVQSAFELEHVITIDIQAAGIHMNINEAIPLGMLINELLTNSVKYAFGPDGGHIQIHLEEMEDDFKVSYADSGRGMQEAPDLNSPKSLGFTIITALLQQLRSNYKLNTDGKFELKFSFNKKLRGSHSNL